MDEESKELSCAPVETHEMKSNLSVFKFETETGEQAKEDALRFAVLDLEKKEGFCSRQWSGKMYTLENIHQTRKIGVMIETTWKYNGTPMRDTNSYPLLPRQKIDLGCDIPGPTTQKFTRKRLAAWFD